MRISDAMLGLVAGATAHNSPGRDFGAMHRAIEMRQPAVYDSMLKACVAAATTLFQQAPTPAPELLDYSRSAAAHTKITDFCQIWSSASIPASLSSAVSAYDSSMATFGPWFSTEVLKIPVTECPSPGMIADTFPTTVKIACTNGERRAYAGIIVSSRTTSGSSGGSATTTPADATGPRVTGGGNGTSTSGAGSPAAPTTAQPAGATKVAAAGMAAAAFLAAVVVL